MFMRRLFTRMPIQITRASVPSTRIIHSMIRRDFASETKVKSLILAVQENDTEVMNKLAKSQPRLIVEQTSNDNTALHEAARLGKAATIRDLAALFSTHFNVNHKCHCHLQRTPLHYAMEGAHLEAVNELISLGADPNIKDEKGRTALDYALKLEAGSKRDELVLLIYNIGGKAAVYQEEGKKAFAAINADKAVSTLLKKNPGETVNTGFDQYLAELQAEKSTRNKR